MTTKDQVAQLIVAEAKARGYTRDECLAVKSTLYQESEWDEEVWDPTHTTYGVAQQDASYIHRFDGAAAQVKAFFDKLDIWRRKPGASTDIWLNIAWMQQRPNWESAQYWFEHGRRAYLTEIKSRIATVTPYLDKYWPTTNGGTIVPATDNRPDFNEFPLFLSGNSHDRNVNDVDLWLMHTQEPPKGSDNRNDAALELRNYLESTKGGGNPVSYHYTGSMANDGGTTVVDCIDTDEASWSVGNSNDRSINFCFAGTRSDWTRQQWLDNERGTIEAAAYLFVQDCAKYPKLKARVLAPNYSAPPAPLITSTALSISRTATTTPTSAPTSRGTCSPRRSRSTPQATVPTRQHRPRRHPTTPKRPGISCASSGHNSAPAPSSMRSPSSASISASTASRQSERTRHDLATAATRRPAHGSDR
ncbi:hypothetical protein R2361_01640 [Mycobacteroides chelonae]|nr:hypothetical protein [Mycobacteroides chelonae]